MTDYEESFVGYNEFPTNLPFRNQHALRPLIDEPTPANHALPAFERIENRPQYARSRVHRDFLETKAAEAEAEAEAAAEEEEEEEGGEEGEEAEGEEGAEEEEESFEETEPEWPPKDVVAGPSLESRYFTRGENLRNKFNEIELDSFMKLLNVKPFKQWQDTSVHHYKLGVHTYEDES